MTDHTRDTAAPDREDAALRRAPHAPAAIAASRARVGPGAGPSAGPLPAPVVARNAARPERLE